MSVDEAIAQARQHLAKGQFEQCRDLCNQVLQAVPRHEEAIALFRSLPAPVAYGADFYAHQAGGSYQSARTMLEYLFASYRPGSLVDFGAGAGTWLQAARELGVEKVLGIEGDWAREHAVAAGIDYRFHDLNERVVLGERFDMALSVEVAEHLVPGRSAGFVHDLCAAADLVVFGAAMPHQGGNGHLNERLPSFWIRLFEGQGYPCIDFFRPALWFQPNVEPWYVQNTFLFVRAGDARARLFRAEPLYDVHHPKLVNSQVQQRFERDWIDEL
jgi:hypothetical protein